MNWLTSLPLQLAIFYVIALVATLVLLIQVVLTFLGADHLGMDDIDAGDGLGILSVRSITGFFGGLGWGGVLALQRGASTTMATLLGAVLGGVLMVTVAVFMRFLYSLKESGTLDYKNAVGEVGTVYLPIPPREEGPGKIRVMVQGRLTVVTAYTQAPERIPSQKKVKVVDQLDERTLLVEPLDGSGSSGNQEGV